MNILKLVVHKLRHPFHHICFDRRFCGRCGYLEKPEHSFVMRPIDRPDSHPDKRKIA